MLRLKKRFYRQLSKLEEIIKEMRDIELPREKKQDEPYKDFMDRIKSANYHRTAASAQSFRLESIKSYIRDFLFFVYLCKYDNNEFEAVRKFVRESKDKQNI